MMIQQKDPQTESYSLLLGLEWDRAGEKVALREEKILFLLSVQVTEKNKIIKIIDPYIF